MSDSKPRWLYRFDNYKRAYGLLREAIELAESRPLNQLEKEGTIQRFEYTWELSWKVMKDFLEDQGIVLASVTPRSTLRAAFDAKLITEGELWMEALDARNRMSHTYSLKMFESVIDKIKTHYLGLFDQLHLTLLEHTLDSEDSEPLNGSD